MGSYKGIIFFSLISSLCFSDFEEQRINFLIAKKDYSKAIEWYLENSIKKKQENPEILFNLAKSIIENSINSTESKDQLLGLYGLMISNSNDVDYDFSKLLESKDPQVQMLTIQYLSRWNEDVVESWLNKAMSSHYLPVRLQALGSLVTHKSKLALSHIESLYYRLPNFVRPIFAQYYAALGTPHSIKILKQMLSDPNREMKIACILSACQYGRDDLREDIRKTLSQPDPFVQESAIFAISHMQDLSSKELIESFLDSSHTNLKLASNLGMIQFHDEKALKTIFDLAETGDLFAIFSLGSISQSLPTLEKLYNSKDPNVTLNVMAALLEKKHPKAKELLIDFLKSHSLYDGIVPTFSTGKTQHALRLIPAFSKQFSSNKEYINYIQGTTQMIREKFLIQAIELPESEFIEIAETIFEHEIFDLIPTLVKLLENCKSEKTISMLKKMSQKPGSPRSRNYSIVALARMKDPQFINQFIDFISSQKKQDIIDLKTFDTQDESIKKSTRFLLTPDEKTQLLIEAYDTLIYLHDERCFSVLLSALLQSPAQNRPVLAGLLLKALL